MIISRKYPRIKKSRLVPKKYIVCTRDSDIESYISTSEDE